MASSETLTFKTCSPAAVRYVSVVSPAESAVTMPSSETDRMLSSPEISSPSKAGNGRSACSS